MDRLSPPNRIPPAPIADLSQWMLRDDVAFLNHGSFGAVPRVVMEEQDRWRAKVEAEPIEMLGRREPELVAAAKIPVAEFLHMQPGDFGLLTNATEGVNAVLNSLNFKPGDELLTTSHVYNAVRMAMRHTARRHGATYREISIPTPIQNGGDIARLILNQLCDRTRLLVIDHITSPTALIFPVEEIVAGCAARGVEVLVDGAHAPGMIDLNVPATGATYYTGNLHKWACAAKGCAFLWVAAHRAADIHPCVVSHLYGRPLAEEFSWQGTRDVSAWLSLPVALRFMAALGWDKVRSHNHNLAAWAHEMLCERLKVHPISPIDGQLFGATATMPLPGRLANLTDEECKALQQSLYINDRIEIPLFRWQERAHLRISCQVYNRPRDYQRLAEAIERHAGA
jgi:isopenicillin-N epimerase